MIATIFTKRSTDKITQTSQTISCITFTAHRFGNISDFAQSISKKCCFGIETITKPLTHPNRNTINIFERSTNVNSYDIRSRHKFDIIIFHYFPNFFDSSLIFGSDTHSRKILVYHLTSYSWSRDCHDIFLESWTQMFGNDKRSNTQALHINTFGQIYYNRIILDISGSKSN